ncbi:hypothetical protein ABIS04_13305 [Shewanella sp. H8]|uniref:hypothetical protein n=1 Tax=Shewanella sp. H8 TaxID=3342676 RepID=UPI003315FFC1
MVMDEGSIRLLLRNIQLEKAIDRKYAFHCITFESLGLFLDLLDELISDCNENKDRYSKGKVHDFLRLRRLQIEGNQYNVDLFNNEEIYYINSFREYISNIRSIILGNSFDISQLIRHITDNIIKSALEYENNPEALIEIIRTFLSRFDHLYYSIKNNFGNINLYIHKYQYCISVINNAIDFELADHRWLTSLIVTRDVHDVFSKVKKSNNLDLIIYKNDFNFFSTVNVRTPFDWCIRKVDDILQELEKSTEEKALKEKLWGIKEKIKFFQSVSPFYLTKKEHLDLEDIKLLRRKFISLFECVDDYHFLNKDIHKNLRSIAYMLSATYNRILNCLELEQKISFSLSEIKKNNTLYIISKNNKKNQSFSFGEENLTSILASNLRCLYKEYPNISVNCEAMVGNGRSDVRLSMGNKTFGLIEAKLINQTSNVENETRNAIDQLYSRYSENENIEGDAEIDLYLILFSYDKNFRKLAKSIKASIYSYSERNSLEYEKISMTENGVRFIYKEQRSNFDFLDKIRTINVMVCNMEIDYKSTSKQRTSNKIYDPSRST